MKHFQRAITGNKLLGADPSAATPRVPLTRRLGRGPEPAPAEPTRRWGPRRVACRGRAALRDFAAFPRPLYSPSKRRGPREGRLAPHRSNRGAPPQAGLGPEAIL